MRKTLIVGAALAVVATACGSPGTTYVSTDDGGIGPAIAVSGTGEVKGRPDTMSLGMGVSVLRPTVDEANAIAQRLADDLISSLESQGITSEDIQTSNYSIHPEWDYRRYDGEDKPELLGYRVTNQVTVKIRDLERAGAIIDDATAAAGDEVTVSGVWFSIEDNEALLQAARAEAWADAAGKADQLAQLAGVTLGTPVSIRESYNQPGPIYYDAREFAADAGASTPIAPGQLEITVSINVEFSIET
jgi:uncharacterized protein YggE